jgi:hypothetical protein
VTKTKHFTYCNDELIDDPLTQSYIDDPRAATILKDIHDHNHCYRSSTGKYGILPEMHVRITPPSLRLAERLKKECNLEVFPASFRNSVHYSEGSSTWAMPIISLNGHPHAGTVGSDWAVRDLLTCKYPFTIDEIDGFDITIYPDAKDEKRLSALHCARMNRRADKNIAAHEAYVKKMNDIADANLSRMTPEERERITGIKEEKA